MFEYAPLTNSPMIWSVIALVRFSYEKWLLLHSLTVVHIMEQ